MAHEPQEVHQRLGQIAHAPVVVNARGILPLRQLAPIRVPQQGQMGEHRGFPAEIVIEQAMLRRRVDPLFPANDVGDCHVVIVHHIREVVGRHAITLHEHLHIDLGPGNFDGTPEQIVDDAAPCLRDLHADHMGFPGVDARRGLLLGKAQAVAVVARRFLGELLGSADLIKALGGAEAGKGMAVGHQLLRCGLVQIAPLALPVGPVGAADLRALIPVQPQPAEGLENCRLAFCRGTGLIRIFDAQHELTALASRKGHVEKGNVGGADVRIPRGARRNAGTDGHGHSQARHVQKPRMIARLRRPFPRNPRPRRRPP